MSEDEFLARWSRRKREARANIAPQPTAKPGDASAEPSLPTIESLSTIEKDEPEFDVSSLPPIESITSATDITAFLRKGIPQELVRAALRRAWAADPVIRDFVGLAENAWDFNDPNAMPGFGPLDCSETDLADLVDRIVGGVRSAADTLADASLEFQDTAAPSPQLPSPEVSPHCERPATELTPAPAVVQPTEVESRESESVSVRHRTHGGALPR